MVPDGLVFLFLTRQPHEEFTSYPPALIEVVLGSHAIRHIHALTTVTEQQPHVQPMMPRLRADLDCYPCSPVANTNPVGGATTIMTAAVSSDAGAQAAKLALMIGSNAADAISCAADLGEELPLLSPVFKTLKAIREKVETVNSNREELKALEERCTYMTACVVVKCRRNSRSSIDVTPLKDRVEAAWKLVERCSRRGRMSRVLKASSDNDGIAALNALVDRLAGDLGLAGIAVLEGKADKMKAMLVSFADHICRAVRSAGIVFFRLNSSTRCRK